MRLIELRNNLVERAAELEQPYLEIRLLLEKNLNEDYIHLITNPNRPITDRERENTERDLELRLSGTPMAYILHKKEFYGNTFYVDENVLIPRPDTETLVEIAINRAKEFNKPRILDLCTGSGAIGTSIAKETGLEVALSDISEAALKVAIRNYREITKREPIAKVGDLLSPWRGERFSIIASNPPYLTEAWYEETELSVKREPRLALIDTASDGLSLIRRIIKDSVDILLPNGYLILEADYRQIAQCAKILSSFGFNDISIAKDLNGKERVIYGRRAN